jgi:hypothetical protein
MYFYRLDYANPRSNANDGPDPKWQAAEYETDERKDD